jgi:hypothetical protein
MPTPCQVRMPKVSSPPSWDTKVSSWIRLVGARKLTSCSCRWWCRRVRRRRCDKRQGRRPRYSPIHRWYVRRSRSCESGLIIIHQNAGNASSASLARPTCVVPFELHRARESCRTVLFDSDARDRISTTSYVSNSADRLVERSALADRPAA